jgi:hypothetical protein
MRDHKPKMTAPGLGPQPPKPPAANNGRKPPLEHGLIP